MSTASEFTGFNRLVAAFYILLLSVLSACAEPQGSCTAQFPVDMSGAIANAENDRLEFRFPLDRTGEDVYPAIFCSSGVKGSTREYHAAEDYHLPAGTPVYAMADGTISFSGPRGGYGWLIIIDHPQANIYSLYGHLSPSRWRLESGSVEKGDLIAYLGDQEENGGSPKHPLRPHLHFGIRAGQRTDYPGMGEWRWQAGWIRPCPEDVGWLQPSGVIAGQIIPPGGFPLPRAGLLEKWGVELAFFAVYLLGGVAAVVCGISRNKPILPMAYAVLMVVAGWFFLSKATRVSYGLFGMAILLFVYAVLRFLRHSKDIRRG